MIITRLTGQLGNQMFQYALGRTLAERNSTELKIDVSGFENPPPFWRYALNNFRIIENKATGEEIARFKKYNWRKGRFWFWYNRLIADRRRYADERQFQFEPWILSLKDPVYLDGYWQTEKYFKDIEPLLRREFTLKKPLTANSRRLENEILAAEAVSLHVRHGEMASIKHINEWHGTCSVEYYQEAVMKMAERVKHPHFFVFSDDPAWVKENIVPNFPTTYVTGNETTPWQDMYLMSRCKHHIIANSTFSWWGAWLDSNEHKIVIAPKKWFNVQKMDTRDIIPTAWITI